MTELNFLFLIKYKVELTFEIKELKKFLFFISIFKFLNLFEFKPINSAGSIPTSDKTEYLPPI